jgi:hypothetical protein
MFSMGSKRKGHPMFSAGAKKGKGNPVTTNYVRFNHVRVPGCPFLNGVAITVDGPADEKLSIPFEKGNMVGNMCACYDDFRRLVEPLPYLFTMHKNDEMYLRPGTEEYSNCVIVMLLEADATTIDAAYCKWYFENRFLPGMHSYTDIGGEPSYVPVWSDEESYKVFPNWRQVLCETNVLRMASFAVVGKNSQYGLFSSLRAFFRKNSANLYACFPEGEVSKNIILTYRLTRDDLKPADWLQAWRADGHAIVEAVNAPGEDSVIPLRNIGLFSGKREPAKLTASRVNVPAEDLVHPNQTWSLFAAQAPMPAIEFAETAVLNAIIKDHMDDFDHINNDELVFLDHASELAETALFNEWIKEHMQDEKEADGQALLYLKEAQDEMELQANLEQLADEEDLNEIASYVTHELLWLQHLI